MKTLNQIKDCQAIDLGYNSFADLVLNPKRDMKMNHLNWCIERSAKQYAKQVAEQALDDVAGKIKLGDTVTAIHRHIITTEIKLP